MEIRQFLLIMFSLISSGAKEKEKWKWEREREWKGKRERIKSKENVLRDSVVLFKSKKVVYWEGSNSPSFWFMFASPSQIDDIISLKIWVVLFECKCKKIVFVQLNSTSEQTVSLS